MTPQLYNEIKDRLFLKLGNKQQVATGLSFVGKWNNQLEDVMRDKENQQFEFDFPAVFIAFRAPSEVQLIGNNVRSFDPLDIEVHILHVEYDGKEGGGELDNNLAVYDYKQAVYKALSLFRPTNCSNWMSTGESEDDNHGQVYHYVQTYRCTFTDYSAQLPDVGAGIYKNPPTNFEDDITILTRP